MRCERLLVGCWMVVVSQVSLAADLTVFAAASLTNALEDIGAAYQAQTGRVVRQSFAASSTLARQIESGAPAGLFISADEQWMDYLAERKLIVATSRKSLLGNTLVLIAPADSPQGAIELKSGFDLATPLGAGRLATGDPAHVPVGKYAQQTLTALGAWPVAEGRLVPADSVRAALALVERGEVPLGIVYATDATITTKVKIVATFPATSHTPIRYPAAVVVGPTEREAQEYLAFLQGDAAWALWRKCGFSVE